MKKWLVKTFVRNPDDTRLDSVRQQYGQLGGIVGIIINLFLFATKLAAGTLFHSISVTGDAFNNLSDAGSSVVSLASFRMAGKPADEDHPFGHARIEYLAASIVAVVILFIGGELIQTSIGKILHPEDTIFSLLTVIVLIFSILAKLWLYTFNRFMDIRIQSSVMQATAIDSLSDVLTTSAVLISAFLAFVLNVRLDGWMGIGVAIFIMVSGLRILKDTIASILGQGPTEETKNNLEAIIMAHEGVLDLHDLMVHDYGPHRTYASVHVEVDAGVDILLSHELIDDIERDILRDMGIHLIIHLDPIVTDDPDANKARELVDRLLTAIEPSLTFHDFRMVKGQTHSNLIFDMVVPFGVRMGMRELTDRFQMDLSKNDPKLRAVITLDRGSGSAPK